MPDAFRLTVPAGERLTVPPDPESVSWEEVVSEPRMLTVPPVAVAMTSLLEPDQARELAALKVKVAVLLVGDTLMLRFFPFVAVFSIVTLFEKVSTEPLPATAAET